MRQHLNAKNSSAAILYIRSVLSKGHTLARFLLETLKPDAGSISILSPDHLDSVEALQFDSGHFPQKPIPARIGSSPGWISPVAGSDDQLVKVVYESLGVSGGVCLMENSSAKPNYPWLQRAKSCVVTHENEVFHVVFSKNHSLRKIAVAIRESQRIPVFVGTVGRLTTKMATPIEKQKTITTSALESIARTPTLIFVGAYDGEGFVIWERNSH